MTKSATNGITRYIAFREQHRLAAITFGRWFARNKLSTEQAIGRSFVAVFVQFDDQPIWAYALSHHDQPIGPILSSAFSGAHRLVSKLDNDQTLLI